nr:MAG TPA: hypothetical protein [Bacteriophage sp.]
MGKGLCCHLLARIYLRSAIANRSYGLDCLSTVYRALPKRLSGAGLRS